jgi:hypothetical protein
LGFLPAFDFGRSASAACFGFLLGDDDDSDKDGDAKVDTIDIL